MSGTSTPSPAKEVPGAIDIALTSPGTEKGNPFTRLVRSLSRSASSKKPKTPGEGRSRSRSRGGLTPGLSTSPPPDSYFPRAPTEEAAPSPQPNSIDARTAEAQGAPGVTFAPGLPGRVIPGSEAESEGWQPAPRRAPSLSRKKSSGTPRSSSKSRDPEVPLPAGDRQGVTLEDKPLSRAISRGASIKRAASKAVKTIGFVPTEKVPGEIRTLILVADGSEEIELWTAYDVLVRAGLGPVLASLSPSFSPSESLGHITLSRGGKMIPDCAFETLKEEHKQDFDAVIVPGGAKGAERLSKDKNVQKLLWSFYESGKVVGTICAGSLAAKSAQIGFGKRLTSHPSVKSELEKDYEYSEERVVVADNLISSRGPGTALEWSLMIVEKLAGKEKRDEVAEPMIV